jgi:hypothetical protein
MNIEEPGIELTKEELKKLNKARDLFQRVAQTAALTLSETAYDLGDEYPGNLVVSEIGRMLGAIVHEVTEDTDDPDKVAALALQEALLEAQEVIKALRGQASSINIEQIEDLADELMLEGDTITNIKH